MEIVLPANEASERSGRHGDMIAPHYVSAAEERPVVADTDVKAVTDNAVVGTDVSPLSRK